MTGKECEPVDSDIEDTLFTASPLIWTVWPMTFEKDKPEPLQVKGLKEERDKTRGFDE